MKKTLAIIVLGSALLFSCGKKAVSTETAKSDSTKVPAKIDSLVFEVDTFGLKIKESKCSNEDCSTCDLYYEKIRNGLKPVHDSVNTYVDALVMDMMRDMGGEELKYDLKKRADAFFKSKRDMEKDEIEPGGGWYWEMNLNIIRPCTEIITVNANYGGYMGGAHPNHYMITTCFFTSTGKMVKMTDLFTDLAAVNKIGLRYFKDDNGLDTDTDCIDQGWDFNDADFALNRLLELYG